MRGLRARAAMSTGTFGDSQKRGTQEEQINCPCSSRNIKAHRLARMRPIATRANTHPHPPKKRNERKGPGPRRCHREAYTEGERAPKTPAALSGLSLKKRHRGNEGDQHRGPCSSDAFSQGGSAAFVPEPLGNATRAAS